jgi:hypothetical protein
VVIADVPSPLAEHHRPSRSDSLRARTICVDPVGALSMPAGPRPIFCPWTDANGPGWTVCIGGMRRPAGDSLRHIHLRTKGVYFRIGFFFLFAKCTGVYLNFVWASLDVPGHRGRCAA